MRRQGANSVPDAVSSLIGANPHREPSSRPSSRPRALRATLQFSVLAVIGIASYNCLLKLWQMYVVTGSSLTRQSVVKMDGDPAIVRVLKVFAIPRVRKDCFHVNEGSPHADMILDVRR